MSSGSAGLVIAIGASALLLALKGEDQTTATTAPSTNPPVTLADLVIDPSDLLLNPVTSALVNSNNLMANEIITLRSRVTEVETQLSEANVELGSVELTKEPTIVFDGTPHGGLSLDGSGALTPFSAVPVSPVEKIYQRYLPLPQSMPGYYQFGYAFKTVTSAAMVTAQLGANIDARLPGIPLPKRTPIFVERTGLSAVWSINEVLWANANDATRPHIAFMVGDNDQILDAMTHPAIYPDDAEHTISPGVKGKWMGNFFHAKDTGALVTPPRSLLIMFKDNGVNVQDPNVLKFSTMAHGRLWGRYRTQVMLDYSFTDKICYPTSNYIAPNYSLCELTDESLPVLRLSWVRKNVVLIDLPPTTSGTEGIALSDMRLLSDGDQPFITIAAHRWFNASQLWTAF